MKILEILLFVQVDTVWAQKWTSPGSSSDWAYAIAVNDSGYAYVTGVGAFSNTYDDWVTIKYSPYGDTIWVRRFSSPGYYNERASSIAIGPYGNIYITGYTMSSGSGDFLIIKYRPNGDTAWTRRYNGIGNGYDFAHWISVDNYENVYVTGYSRGYNYQDDIAVVKYDSSGNQLWVARYNGSGNYNDKGHKVITEGNYVYVVGYVNPYSSGTFYDYVVLKYDLNGNLIWARTYNGPSDSSDIARDIAVDNEGNVYVTGSSYGQGTSTDIVTIKYNSNGDVLWIARYNNDEVNGADGGYGIRVDNEGNVYVVGQSMGLNTGSDIVIIKYDSDGNLKWVTRYDGPVNGYDTPSDEVGGKCMAIDQFSNIYVGGTSRGETTYNDYVVLMVDSSGVIRWEARYDFSDTIDYALALAIDGNNGVYITGRTLDPSTYYDWGTVKFVNLVGISENKKISKSLFFESKEFVNLYDISGRLIKRFFNSSQNSYYLKPGIYIFESNNQKSCKKVIIK